MPVNDDEGTSMPARDKRTGPVTDTVARLGRRLHRGTANPHPGVLAAIAIALLIAAAVSWRALELSASDINWPLIGLSAVLVPVSVTLTAAEYRLIGRMNGVTVAWPDSLTITVVGTVANLLPIPGAAAVRVNDLVARKAKTARAAAATLGIGVLWLGWALVVSGVALMISDSFIVGMALTAGGATAVIASWFVSPRDPDSGVGSATWITRGSAIELASLAVGAARIWLILAALGSDPTFIQAVGLVAAGAIASTVGIVPGGLGIRELIAGILAPLVNLEVAAAIVTIAMARIVGLAVSAPIAVLLARRRVRNG